MKLKNERDKDWLNEIEKLLTEINELQIERINNNSRRNNMRKQLKILKVRMGYKMGETPKA